MALAQRIATRIPTPQLNRFLSEAVAARQPPAGSGRRPTGHRLKLLFMTQTAERPPRFSIQVNNRARVTRDYAYFLENRLRERFALEGIPVDHRLRGARRTRRSHRPSAVTGRRRHREFPAVRGGGVRVFPPARVVM